MEATRGFTGAIGADRTTSPLRAASPRASDERARVVELAQEFESLVVLQMVRQMRQSMLSEETESGFGLGSETLTDTVDVELARHLSRVGGMGLADVLAGAIDRQIAGRGAGAAPLATTPEPAAPVEGRGTSVSAQPVDRAIPASLTADGALVPLPLADRVTSPFGWRQDPFGRGARFHAGVDIGAAYGKAVPVAAGGKVVFAGEQQGYGRTVVVQHDDGVTTRYGHLADYAVEAGDRVEAGDILGRVGSTGRSTGPHLHFEVQIGGQAVNPLVAASRYAEALKVVGSNADFPNDRLSRLGGTAGVDHED